MRRHKHLFDQIVSFQNLLLASERAQRGKRFRQPTARFNFQLERELWKLRSELIEGRYRPGKYRHFTVHEPKKRIISAAPYRDRIVHHAVHNVLGPVFEPTFVHDSYATRKGKGTHAALDRFQLFARQNRYVLKCDIKQYFPSIRHDILFNLIGRKVGCKATMRVVQVILDSHRSSADMADELRFPTGIPIGNLTSQFFANIYLNGLDHHLKERLKCRYFVRYMDDFVIFHSEKDFLWNAKDGIEKYLGGLALLLHEEKCRIFTCERGVPFLGMVVFPKRRRLRRQNVVRLKRRLQSFRRRHKEHLIDWPAIRRSIESWIGHARHAQTVQLRKLVLEDAVF